MEKIIKKLLTVTFPSSDIASLMEVIYATPNPQIATEILCGMYEEQFVAQQSKKDDVVRTLVSYNKWNNRVDYSYSREKTRDGYFFKDVKDTVTLENFDSLKQSWTSGKDLVSLSLPTGEYEERTSYCSLEEWQKYALLE